MKVIGGRGVQQQLSIWATVPGFGSPFAIIALSSQPIQPVRLAVLNKLVVTLPKACLAGILLRFPQRTYLVTWQCQPTTVLACGGPLLTSLLILNHLFLSMEQIEQDCGALDCVHQVSPPPGAQAVGGAPLSPVKPARCRRPVKQAAEEQAGTAVTLRG